MSCIITYKGKKYSEEQFKEYFNNNKQEFTTYIAKNKDVIDSFKRKMEGIDFVFSQSPELTSIGSKAQYIQYLSTIFPDSQVKDIVYNASNYNSQIPTNTVYKSGLFLSDQLEYVKNFSKQNNKKFINALLINSKNIKYTDKEDIQDIGRNKEAGNILNSNDLQYIDYLIEEEGLTREAAIKIVTKETFDTLKYTETEFGTKDKYGFIGNEYVVFEPEQIHILGSRQDIEKAKQFLSKEVKTPKVDVKGIEINSYQTGLGNDLTNVHYANSQYPKSKYPITPSNKSLTLTQAAKSKWGESVEAWYKSNQAKTKGIPEGEKGDKYDFDLMVGLITDKLTQYPNLVQQINERGGLAFLEKSTHNMGIGRWSSKNPKNMFMNSLIQAYKNVSKEVQLTSTQEPIEEKSELPGLNNLPKPQCE